MWYPFSCLLDLFCGTDDHKWFIDKYLSTICCWVCVLLPSSKNFDIKLGWSWHSLSFELKLLLLNHLNCIQASCMRHCHYKFLKVYKSFHSHFSFDSIRNAENVFGLILHFERYCYSDKMTRNETVNQPLFPVTSFK